MSIYVGPPRNAKERNLAAFASALRRSSPGYQYKEGVRQANEANQARYEELTGLLGGLRDDTNAAFANLGQEGRRRIDEDAANQLGIGRQDLIRRGLSNSSLISSLQRGVATDRQRNLQALNESLAVQRANMNVRTTGMLAGAIERRNDIAPNFSQYAALAQLQQQQNQFGQQQQQRGYYGY